MSMKLKASARFPTMEAAQRHASTFIKVADTVWHSNHPGYLSRVGHSTPENWIVGRMPDVSATIVECRLDGATQYRLSVHQWVG